MSTTIASSDPALLPPALNVTYPAREGQTDADWARTGKHTLSYAGPYLATKSQRVSDMNEAGTVRHGPLRVAHVPAMNGTVQERAYTLVKNRKADRSYRFLEVVSESEGLRTVLWWKRLDWDRGPVAEVRGLS